MRAVAALAAAALFASAARAQPAVPPGAILDAPPGDGRWHWIAVEPARDAPTGWVVLTGTAELSAAGGRLHALLRPDPGQPSGDIRLDGRVAGGRVRATERLLNTDAGPATVRGTWRRLRLGGVVEQRIALRGGQAGDASFLGLARRGPR